MFTLGVRDHVMIAHSFASEFFGPAQRVHGATYTVEAEVDVPALEDHGVVLDIGALRGALRRILDGLDYSNLDEHPAFPGRTSTTERVAAFLADELAAALAPLLAPAQRSGAALRVRLHESPVAWAACARPIA